jgi:hypothetical protein
VLSVTLCLRGHPAAGGCSGQNSEVELLGIHVDLETRNDQAFHLEFREVEPLIFALGQVCIEHFQHVVDCVVYPDTVLLPDVG